MAAPAWATDMTDVILEPTTTGWTALGGGASALVSEGDDYIQGTLCLSKGAWTNAIKGMIYSAGTMSVAADGAIMAWIKYDATGSLDVRQPAANSPGGLMMIVGSATSAYRRYNVGGSETLTFDSWVPYVINPDNTLYDGGSVGSPSTTESYVGCEANLPTTSGPTKGNPIKIDAIRYGRCRLDYTLGESANYNTFNGAEAYGNATSRRWGLLELVAGAYRLQGFHRFGITGGAICDHRDSNKNLFIRRTTLHVTSAFNRFEVQNASSNIAWTGITITSLSTVSRGTWVTTDNPTISKTDCVFTDMGTFGYGTNTTILDTVYRRCLRVTAAGGSFVGCTFAASAVAADGAALGWGTATDPSTPLTGTTFTKGTNAHHAIEFGVSSPLSMTLTNVTVSGFNASNAQNDSVLYIKRTSGTVTISLVGCTGTFSYKTDGATVVVQASVSLTVKVQTADKVAIQNAQTSIFLADSPFTQLMNEDTNVSGIATEGYNYGGDVDVVIKVRKSETTDSPRYLGFSDTQQITADGLSVIVTLKRNPVLA